ncbi:MAG: hypothetical protein JJ899_02175 [Alphaproteobacteria bacterium]|nr:hypothetical protein [Alphaproteobacteria bacterium]
MKATIAISAVVVFLAAPASAQPTLVAGPHLSGDAYTVQRRDAPHEVVAFEIEAGTRTSALVRGVVVGPDYAVETAGDRTRLVYDFRFRRLLSLPPGEDVFANESLFGHARTRFSFLQNNLSASAVAIAGGLTEPGIGGAARFVSEHLNGMAHPADVALRDLPRPELQVSVDGSDLTGALGETTVFAATLTDTAFPSLAHARTFAAWLTWGGRMHPDVALAIAETGRLPDEITFTFPDEIRAINPGAETEQVFEFRDMEIRAGAFDMLRGRAARVPSWEPYLPETVARTMVDAANGVAPNGPKSDIDFMDEMSHQMALAKSLDAVLTGLHASHPYDGCQGDYRARPLCITFGGVMNQARANPHVKTLFGGFAAEAEREYRLAARIWVPLRQRAIDRVDVLDFMIANALVEAHKKSPLKGEMATAFEQLPQLYERAFPVDPYDPARYRDIYNYLLAAATGLSDRYLVATRAHAVIDLARALPDRPMPEIILQVVQADARIAADFPALFPIFDRR